MVLLESGVDRDWVIRDLEAQGVQSRAYFPPIHLMPYIAETYGFRPGAFPRTEEVSRRALALPFHARLTEAEVSEVVGALGRVLNRG
ncbi:MAG: DegT/DnrJ/EryC1/StrS family aminotransferase [Planctomycetes bacterium]|nr:DegT/DnrJ/EryC1/StrS family aminotransferase [Planctomycetota bacterium]